MSDKNTTVWWRNQIPTAVLLLIMAVIIVWSLAGNVGAAQGVSPMTTGKGSC